MTDHSNVPHAPSTDITDAITVGEPDIVGPLAVYPLFGPPTNLIYRAFADPGAGASITELEGGASVNDLLVHNEGDQPVLLYEGEEITGAQQNRVLDVSVLIAAGSKTRIPVSCVEQGRWDGRRHRELFRPSRQAADPRMRRLKSRRARTNAAAGLEARADQGEVWDEVQLRQHEFEAASPTAAMADIYEAHRDRLARFREGVSRRDDQCGSVAVIGGRIAMLDFVGRADVYAVLHDAIVEGYALDALAVERRAERVESSPAVLPDGGADEATVRGFVLLASDARAAAPSSPNPGIGLIARFAGNGVEGSALSADDDLVQLTAFPADGGDESSPGRRPARRISRPSRRRG